MKKIIQVFINTISLTIFLYGQNNYVLSNVNIIDGISSRVQKDKIVIVSNGKIESIKKNGSIPKDYTLIDLKGMYLLPGFIDAHTHIRSLDAARRALESGVTTARSASTPGYQDVAIREMVHGGQLIGPEIVASGVFVTPNLGETIFWKATDKGHNVEFIIKGGVPDNVEKFKSKVGKDIEYTFVEPGIYAYWCTPHKTMGMIGFVIVDNDLSNLESIKKIKYLGKSKKIAKELIDQIQG